MTASSRRLSLSFVAIDCSDEMVSDAVDIAAALQDRGHTIDFAASGGLAGRIRATGFAVTPLAADRFGRVPGLDQWLRASATDAVHLFGHAGVWSTATAARRLRTPLYWTVGAEAPASAPAVGVLIAYSAHVGRRLAASGRLRLEHMVVEPARIACGPLLRAVDGGGDDARAAMEPPNGARVIVATSPAESTTMPGLEQAAAAVARLRRDGHDVVLLHVGGGSAMSRLGRSLERRASGMSVVPTVGDVASKDPMRTAVAVLGSGRGAYRGMLADRPTLVLGANGYAGDCTAAQVETLSAYDFTGTNVTRRNDRIGVDQLVASLRPLLERQADERVWLGSGWARARIGADVAAVTYENLYLRRRPVPRGGSAAVCRYETFRLGARAWQAMRGPIPVRSGSRPIMGPGGTKLLSGLERALARPAACDVVVHVFAGVTAAVTRAHIDLMLQLHEAGWSSTLVLPTARAWSEVARVCTDAGVRVERVAAVPPGTVAALRYGVRMSGVLREHLDQWGAAVVHAHDDEAALVWGLAARASGVPLVWDADLDRRAVPFDRIRSAVASYLVLDGSGGRRIGGRRRPPHHRRKPSPRADARALAQALEQLTGRVAVSAVDPAITHAREGLSVADLDHVDAGR